MKSLMTLSSVLTLAVVVVAVAQAQVVMPPDLDPASTEYASTKDALTKMDIEKRQAAAAHANRPAVTQSTAAPRLPVTAHERVRDAVKRIKNAR